MKAARLSSAAGTRSPQVCSTTGKSSTAGGKFNNEPTEEAALKERIERLERLVGRLTLENEFLKKGLQNSLSQYARNGRSSPGGTSSALPGGGAGS